MMRLFRGSALVAALFAFALAAVGDDDPQQPPLIRLRVPPRLPGRTTGDPKREYLQRVTDDLARFLKGKNETAVALAFQGPAQFKTSFGSALTQIAADLLEKQGIRVAEGTKYAFSGKFTPDERPDFNDVKQIGLALDGEIVDVFNKPATGLKYQEFITDEKTFEEALGGTVDLNGSKTAEDRGAVIRTGMLKPTFYTNQNLVRASRDSRFALGVEVNGALKPIESKNGLAYVALELGDNYKVRAVNDSPFEAAVDVKVDGLSVFYFSELRARDPSRSGEPEYRYWTLATGQSLAVPGWHKRDSSGQQKGLVRNFTIAPFEEGEAFKLGHIEDIGTITATFMACWEEGKTQPPPDEVPVQVRETVTKNSTPHYVTVRMADGTTRRVQTEMVSAEERISTRMGQEVSTDVRGVKRVFGRPRATVTIRYARPVEGKK